MRFGFAAVAFGLILFLGILSGIQAQEKSDAASLDFITANDDTVIIIRPAKLLKEKALGKVLKSGSLDSFLKMQNRSAKALAGVNVENLDQVTIINDMRGQKSLMIYRTKERNGFDKLTESMKEGEVDGVKYFAPGQRIQGQRYCHVADKQTIVWSSSLNGMRTLAGVPKRGGAKNADWRVTWRNFEEDRIVFIFGREMFKAVGNSPMEEPYRSLSDPFLKASYIVGSMTIDDKIRVFGEVQLPDKATAKKVKESTDKLAQMAKLMLNQLDEDAIGEREKPMVDFAKSALKTYKVTVESDRVVASVVIDIDLDHIAALMNAQFGAATRTQSANNIRQLAIAMHTYHDVYKSLPPAVIVHESGHRHSWRIAILPFLEQNALYKQYRLDEPWDSKHNREVTSRIPEVFKHPDADPESLNTNYFAVVGDGLIFDGTKGTCLEEIADGSSRTILLVEGTQKTHWAKPEDIPFNSKRIKRLIGGLNAGGTNVVFADCSVRFISDKVDATTLIQMLTRSMGDRVDLTTLDK